MANRVGTFEVDPISRIEGHLGVQVTVGALGASGGITEANAHGNLWRGFENFLIGRDVNDAITVCQRICGVCPVPHGQAATFNAESALGINRGMQTFADTSLEDMAASTGVPAKAVLIRNLVLASEFLMSSITHFYHLAALSYVQGPPIPPWTPFYQDSQYSFALVSAGHGAAADGSDNTGSSTRGVIPRNATSGAFAGAGFSQDLWSAVIKQYVKALRIRRLTFEAAGMFAGRMPMTSCYVAGGVTNTAQHTRTGVELTKTGPSNVASGNDNFAGKITLFYNIMKEIGSFVVREYVPVVLALGVLYPGFDNTGNTGLNLTGVGTMTGLGYGHGCGNHLAWGGFPNVGASGTTHSLAIQGGYKVLGATGSPVLFNTGSSTSESAVTFVKANLIEETVRSNYVASTDWGYGTGATSAYPGDITRTEPNRNGGTKYSWLKAPRLKVGAGGAALPFEVGPLARGVVNSWYPQGTAIVAPGNVGNFYLHPTYTSELDARCIHPDLAVALVREGLCAQGSEALVLSGSGENARFSAGSITDGSITLVTLLAAMKGGLSTMDRLRARAIESVLVVSWIIGAFDKSATMYNSTMGGWLSQLSALGAAASGYTHYAPPTTSGNKGVGATEAPRGALMHVCTTDGTTISAYQCIVPTTWNGSPKDGTGSTGAAAVNPATSAANNNAAATKRGPIEQAMIGAPFDNTVAYLSAPTMSGTSAASGVEVLRIAQSFDPCIACAVH
jgi:Ni,Fe-hydrogenase I large subunit